MADSDSFLPSDQVFGSPNAYPPIERVVDTNETSFVSMLLEQQETTSLQTVFEVPLESIQSQEWERVITWTGSIRERFDSLVLKDALGEATATELNELEQLQRKRRRLHHPRLVLEIERDIMNERALKKVIEGLSEYVRPL